MSIQGLILEVRVTGCRKLRDTEFFTRQDPYVVLEYATTKLRTRTCTDGGRNPTFDDKFHIPLIEGLRELNVNVWNSNTFSNDDFIGSGRVQLHRVLTHGYDDSSWPLQTRHMRSAGEVKLIMHFDVSAMKNKMGKSAATSTTRSIPPMPAPAPAPVLASAMPYTASSPSYPPSATYPAAPAPAPAPVLASAMPYTASSPSYPPSATYPAAPAPAPALASAMPYTASSPSYPPATYPPATYPAAPPYQAYPTPSQAPYPAPAYPPAPPQQPCLHHAYPPTTYPPQPYGQPYPPPPAAQSLYPPAPYPGTYPPPPY